MLNFYTFYLFDGSRKVFLGVSPDDAYLNSQPYSEGQRAIMYETLGITAKYHYSLVDDTKLWVTRVPYCCNRDQALQEDIISVFNEHHAICVLYPNLDTLKLQRGWIQLVGRGWVEKIEVSYQRYGEKSYTGVQYFSPEQTNDAVYSFTQRLISEPASETMDAHDKPLDIIYESQTPDQIFVALSEPEQLWLLGSFIKRFEQHEALPKRPKKTVIQPDKLQHPDLIMLYKFIQFYAGKWFTTGHCQHDTTAREFVERYFYISTTQVDDEGMIHTDKGIIPYGSLA